MKSSLFDQHASADPLADAWDIQQKAATVGFDWPDITGALEKVVEEFQEIKTALEQNDLVDARKEVGDLLFAVVNVCRFLNVHPHIALEDTNRKFIRRFQFVEQTLKEQGIPMASATLEQMDVAWELSKKMPAPSNRESNPA